jgi:adenylate kinase
VKYQTILLFGAPGSGKGTQGKILGSIPGFYHCACGDVFRSLDLHSDLGKTFLEYSSRGELVPDDVTVKLWANQIDKVVSAGRFHPESDLLVLDGLPRNCSQAKMVADKLDIRRVFHLTCPDRSKLIERLKRRALKDNRYDDANEQVIANRLHTYEEETKPVLAFYGESLISHVDASQAPYKVLRDILTDFSH